MPKYLKTKEGSLESAVLEAVSPAQQAAIAISKKEKGDLIQIARKSLKDIKKCFRGRYKFIPTIHFIPYLAVLLDSLQLLVLWQLIKVNIWKKGLSIFKHSAGPE